MKEILETAPALLVLLIAGAFVFAVVMQPIFIWIICVRMKRTNQLLQRLADKPQHTALVTPNPMGKASR